MRQDAHVRPDAAASTTAHRGPAMLLAAAATTGALIGVTTDPTARLASALVYALLFTLGAVLVHLLVAFIKDTLEA